MDGAGELETGTSEPVFAAAVLVFVTVELVFGTVELVFGTVELVFGTKELRCADIRVIDCDLGVGLRDIAFLVW